MTKETVAPAGLPEKEWFSLGEIAERWGCSVDDLVQFGAQGDLEICALFQCEQVEWSMVEEVADPAPDEPPHLTVPLGGGWLVGPYAMHPLDLYQPGSAEVSGGYVKRPRVPPERTPMANHPAFSYPEPANGLSGSLMGESFRRHVSELVVIRAERDRFEEENRVGAHAGEMPKPDKIDGRERTTLLQMIRVMDRKIDLEDAPKAAARELQEYAALFGLEIRGKADTLADKIKAARNLED